jgi:hypothetical protein
LILAVTTSFAYWRQVRLSFKYRRGHWALPLGAPATGRL